MARARNIKPGLFKNEILGEADPLYSLLFVGLWTIADKEGRLEYRPKRIKAELFPYRFDLDLSIALAWLKHESFITVYEIDQKTYIQISNWKRHQSPHHKEVASVIPPISCIEKTHKTQCVSYAQAKHEPSMNQAWLNKSASSPLIPDSLNLIPYNNTLSIADDFQPSDEIKQRALLAMVPEKIVSNPDEVLKFISHHKSKGTISKDWNEEFFKWLMNAKVFSANRGNSNAANKPGDTKRETALDRNKRETKQYLKSIEQESSSGDGEVVATTG